MLVSPVVLVALSIVAGVPDAREARLSALVTDDATTCWEVAPGRKATPVRENFLTYSDVVAEIPRGKVFFGERVPGENKVLVLTPSASTPIGVARHTFLKAVDKSRCSGDRLFAPRFETLLGWGQPLPGVAPSPHIAVGDAQRLHQGCYVPKSNAVIVGADGAKLTLAKGQAFFGGDALEGSRVSARLAVLDPESGNIRGQVARNKVERVALSLCGDAR